MDFDALTKEIANAERVPDAALAALVPHAARLAPQLEALARRRIEGDWLFPTEDNLLFYGLFVIAAAQDRSFWPTWLEILRSDEDDLEGLFGDGAIMSIRSITLGLVGEDVEPVAELAQSVDISNDARAGLIDALARLMCEGRYPREDFVKLIDRLASLDGAEDDHRSLWCITEAIVLGGIGERGDMLNRLMETHALSVFNEVDILESRQRLARAAADPSDLARFDEDGISAPKAPADALGWLKSIQRYERTPADLAPLPWREREWLGAFLKTAGAPDDAMSFEELDGFFHALVIGPELVMPSEYVSEIWGEGPVFDNQAQVSKVMGLFQQHWNAISGRVAAGAQPQMWLEPSDDDPPGARWACGFARGVALRELSWKALLDDDAALSLECIFALETGELASWERAEFLAMLGDHFSALAEFWREHRTPRRPRRTEKVGRNDPCPCGSGKKWKKCCGALPPPSVH